MPRRSIATAVLLLGLCRIGDPAPAAAAAWPPACESALQALGMAEEAARAAAAPASAPSAAVSDRLQAARRTAAQACLGEALAASAPLPSRSAPALPGAGGVSAVRVVPIRPLILPALPAAPAARPPVTISTCDAAGCWASDGSRLQQQGPVLVGPRGVCTQTAGVLNCP